MIRRLLTAAAALLALAACGVDTEKVVTHTPYARDGALVSQGKALTFAVVGSTRSVIYGTSAEPKVPSEVIGDIRNQMALEDVQFILLTGGYVRRSTTDEWSRFGSRWAELVKSEARAESQFRKPVIALPGPGERIADPTLQGYGAAFPDQGHAIGLGRVASWGHFDVQAGDKTWRFLVVDTAKKALGSRWKEQMFWLPTALEGNFDHLVVFMSDPLLTLAKNETMDRDDAPSEILQVVTDSAGVLKLKAIISGGTATNELFLPSGAFGEAYVVAGNGGIASPDLAVFGPADEAGFDKDISLEPMFNLALMKEFRRAHTANGWDKELLDKATRQGDWAGFTAYYDGEKFPVQGWWVVTVKDDAIRLKFRMRRPEGDFFDLYSMTNAGSGWKPDKAK